MNLKRAIWGPLLSVVFLAIFVYIIAGIQSIFDFSSKNISEEELLGSVSDNVQNTDQNISQPVVAGDPGLNESTEAAVSVLTNLSDVNKIIIDKNGQKKLSMASISKLMTALVVVDNYDLSWKITISAEAAHQSTDPEPIKAGEIFYVKDLLYAMLIGSDNTASYALSEKIGADKFIGLMNAKAQELGLSDTSFLNPTGLGLSNFSTARDLVKLAEYLIKNRPSIFGITTTQEIYLYTVDGKILHKIVNTNVLLNDPSLAQRIVGGKTGDTKTAGECLLLAVKSLDGKNYLISVILDSEDRFGEMKKIINWSDASYTAQ